MKIRKDDKKNRLVPEGKSLSKFMYFSGMGFQMIAVIGFFAFIGYKIDESKGSVKPIFTAIFSVIGVGLSLYSVIKSVIKNKDS